MFTDGYALDAPSYTVRLHIYKRFSIRFLLFLRVHWDLKLSPLKKECVMLWNYFPFEHLLLELF